MLFVVVPAYNEEKNIGRVIGGLFEKGITRIEDKMIPRINNGLTLMTVVVVDDGSSDNTAEVAKSVGAVVLKHEVNRGQGAALQTGDEYALENGATAVVHFDADGQFNPADIIQALVVMKEKNADVILGSRFLDNRSQIPWTKKHLVLPVARLINYFLTGLKLTDAHNGFRILSRKALEKINISQDRMAHNSEIIKQIKQKNLSYLEYPVEVTYNEYGQGVAGGLKIVWEILQGRFMRH